MKGVSPDRPCPGVEGYRPEARNLPISPPIGPTVGVAIVAGAIAAVSGFGIGSLLTPLLLLWMPAAEAVAVVALPHALATTIRLIGLRRDVHLPTFRQFGIASALGGLTGAALQGRLASPVLTLTLAALLMLAGLGELANRRLPLPRSPGWRLAGGMLSGVFGGLVGNQGGIRAAALLGFNLTGRNLVATATASAILVDAARVPVYLHTSGGAMANAIPLILWLSAGVTVGTAAGVPLLSRLPETWYRRLLGSLLFLLALWLAGSWLLSAP